MGFATAPSVAQYLGMFCNSLIQCIQWTKKIFAITPGNCRKTVAVVAVVPDVPDVPSVPFVFRYDNLFFVFGEYN